MSVPNGISRREALGLLGFGLLAACAKKEATTTALSTSSTTTGAASTSTTASSSAACILQPEVTEGPYYLDVNKVRSDITEGRPGIPLALKLVVVDAAGCLPIKDAVVDVWHCDAGGDYSGVSGVAGTFLRGTQVSDGAGVVQFNTIFPGWYRGRAVHIHLKVHVGGSVVHTGQLFFDDAVLAAVSTRAPYSSRGAPDQSNSSDSIFRQSGGSKAIVPVTEQGSGYAGAITLGVQGGQGIQ